MNVFSASPVQSCDLISGRLRKPPPPRDPEGRRGAMSESTFFFFIGCAIVLFVFAFAIAAWVAVILFTIEFLREYFGIDLLARWRKRE